MANVHEKDLSLNRHGLEWVNHMKDLGVLTETNLGTLTPATVAGLNLLYAGATVHEKDTHLLRQAQTATTLAQNAGALTDAMVAAAKAASNGTRINTLLANFTATDPNLAAGYNNSFAF
jgi:2-oxo-4-hydroxy-4-carboxy--5-ureidoimidazoline (OHCU) decarboxylase